MRNVSTFFQRIGPALPVVADEIRDAILPPKQVFGVVALESKSPGRLSRFYLGITALAVRQRVLPRPPAGPFRTDLKYQELIQVRPPIAALTWRCYVLSGLQTQAKVAITFNMSLRASRRQLLPGLSLADPDTASDALDAKREAPRLDGEIGLDVDYAVRGATGARQGLESKRLALEQGVERAF